MTGLLEAEVEAARRTIGAEGYPMSIGELSNLYIAGELRLQPRFQRFFRWTLEQKSKLIESILMGIPIPSIFVAQREDGTWELVDGLQRVSTLLEFQGLLKSEEGEPLPASRLTATKHLPSLKNKCWELPLLDDGSEDPNSLTSAQRLDIKRSKLDLKIIKRESSPEAKFDLFQRLNSYGSKLTPQELRTASIAAVCPELVDLVEELARQPPFKDLCRLSEQQLEQQYDFELVLRFLVLHDKPETELTQNKLREFNTYLDNEAISLGQSFETNASRLRQVFDCTFQALANGGDDDIFRARKKDGTVRSGRFLNTSYEVFAIGLGYHIAKNPSHKPDIAAAVEGLWSHPDMQALFATGKSTEWRLSRYIPIGRELMK